VGLLITLSKRMKRKEASLRERGWGQDSDRGELLLGRTLGIVGLGRTGMGVAQRLRGWGMRIIAYNHVDRPERFREAGVEQVGLDELFAQSDYVSVHLMLTAETRGIIGEKQLRLMKQTSYLVNTSRGQVIDEAALVRALQEERIAGAALDVFEQEPLPADSPLRMIDPERLILTPHAITHTWESRDGGLRMAVESALTLLEGRVPETVVNPEVIPTWQQRFGQRVVSG
jgi:phosphoglycerate dehydrogenase-like enzyme